MTMRVYVLGAGASHFAGYPLALDLWPFIRDLRSNEMTDRKAADAVIVAMDKILPQGDNHPDLEKLFTLLDLTDLGMERFLHEKVDWRDLRPKFIRMISWAFLWHEYQIQDRIRKGSDADVLGKWTELIKPGDTIITLNWDILHEAALFRAGKWHYADGYGFRCSDAPTGVASPTKIFKLHGSVNWGQQDEFDIEPAIVHKQTFFFGAQDGPGTFTRGSGWDDGRKLIIPTYLKDVASNRLLLQLWNQAADALASADEVIVLGYSLNPADALARHLLGSALLRNESLQKIYIVDPKPTTERWDESLLPINHWDHFTASLGKEDRREFIRRKFEEWVLDGGEP